MKRTCLSEKRMGRIKHHARLTLSKCDFRHSIEVHHVAIASRLSSTAPLTE